MVMRLIGLTGGIATGKSTFTAALRDAGAPVIDADVLARRVVEPGQDALAQVVYEFGREVLAADGSLDRRRVAQRVFADSTARARLEAIIHPAIKRQMVKERDRFEAEGHPLAFYDAPLLFEAGIDRQMDLNVLVYAPRQVALERLMARDRLTRDEAEARLAAQLSIEEKRARADVVVLNDSTADALRAKAVPLLTDLPELSRRPPGAGARIY